MPHVANEDRKTSGSDLTAVIRANGAFGRQRAQLTRGIIDANCRERVMIELA